MNDYLGYGQRCGKYTEKICTDKSGYRMQTTSLEIVNKRSGTYAMKLAENCVFSKSGYSYDTDNKV